MRPALLVAEKEPENGLSTRKLLLETAKYNVITSHSAEEALESLKVFAPGLAALVVTSHLGPEDDCHTVAKAFKEARPKAPIFFLSPTGINHCDWADHHLSTYEPERLLTLVRKELGDPNTKP
jgi:CheY-like chemotaxis protein